MFPCLFKWGSLVLGTCLSAPRLCLYSSSEFNKLLVVSEVFFSSSLSDLLKLHMCRQEHSSGFPVMLLESVSNDWEEWDEENARKCLCIHHLG